jgi:enoyl-CoA hydratase
MEYQNIRIENDGYTRVLIINRPDKLNALNRDTIAELGNALKTAEADNTVRVIIVTGAGAKAFVAGADISEFAHFSKVEGEALSRSGQEILFNVAEQLNKPVIAAVNGFALGGGLELAMSCHIRIASSNAKLGLPEVSLGVIPGYGGTQRLQKLIGRGHAAQMICSAEMISAETAEKLGLVNQVVTQDELLETCKMLANKIALNSPTAIKAALKAMLAADLPGVNGYDAEIREFGNAFGTEDFKEGTGAFLEKRKPTFTGN